MNDDSSAPQQVSLVDPQRVAVVAPPPTPATPTSVERDLERETATLSIEKLKLEIRDLKTNSVRSVLAVVQVVVTALLTLTIAAGGWIIESRFNTDDSFDRSVKDLVGTSAPERADGALKLASVKDPAMSGIARSIMVTQLSKEDDPLALGILSDAIVKVGSDSVPLVADANRTAALAFASALGRYVGLKIHDNIVAAGTMKHFTNFPNSLQNTLMYSSQPSDSDEHLLIVDFNASDAEAVFHVEKTALHLNAEDETILPPFILAEQTLHDAYRQAVVSAAGLTENEREKGDIRSALLDIDQRALGLAATSHALAQLLQNYHAKSRDVSLKDVSLRNVVLLSVQLDSVDLSGFDFRNAYIAGTSAGLKCEYCDLRGAMLSQLYLPDADLKFAGLDEATLRNFSDTPSRKRSSTLPDLTGANWGDATITQDDSTSPLSNDDGPWAKRFPKRLQNSLHEQGVEARIADKSHPTTLGDPYVEQHDVLGNPIAKPVQVAKT